MNPTYFYHLALRWFSCLLYTCQNHCNKKVWGGFFSPLRLTDYPPTLMHIDKWETQFSPGQAGKKYLKCSLTFFLHVQWGPGRSPLHEHQCEVPIYIFRKSEPECALWVWANSSSVHLQRSSTLQELMSLLGHHSSEQKCARFLHVWHSSVIILYPTGWADPPPLWSKKWPRTGRRNAAGSWCPYSFQNKGNWYSCLVG